MRILSRSDLSDIKRNSLSDEVQHALRELKSDQSSNSENFSREPIPVTSDKSAAICLGRLIVDFTYLLNQLTIESMIHILQADYEYLDGNPLSGFSPNLRGNKLTEEITLLNRQIKEIEQWLGD